MSYTAALHQHRLAAWCASTAARASKYCRFEVEKGIRTLEGVGFDHGFGLANLPAIPDIDTEHEKWRKAIIVSAGRQSIDGFTHGVAAKLINCYLKVRFVCGPYWADPRVRALQPPIDRVLLKRLAKANAGGHASIWREARDWGWSLFTSEIYQKVIDHVRRVADNEMWKIEEYWQGYQ